MQQRKRPKKKSRFGASYVAIRISFALPCLQSCLQTATLACLG